jgi:hypothetical protein
MRVASVLYPSALFLSDLLLFAIQPMFSKMVLPRIGGAAAVWSVAMVFFQAALLLGYAYAHLLCRTLSPGVAAVVHLGLLGVAAITLPIGIAKGFEAVPQEWHELWLLALFATSIGLPFVASPRARRPERIKSLSSLRGVRLVCGIDGVPVRC